MKYTIEEINHIIYEKSTQGGKESTHYSYFMLQVGDKHSQNKTLIKKRRDIWEKMMRENLLYHFIDFNCSESVSRKSDYNVDKEEWEYFYGMADGMMARSKECILNHKGKVEDVEFKHNDVYPDLADYVFVLFEGGKKAYHQINFFTTFLIYGEITSDLKELSDSVPIEKDANKFGI